MKIVAIGDIHGHSGWRAIVSANLDADKIIFIGDYFDTTDPNILPRDQQENFKDIIAFKKANMDKVVLLFGNHDFHYLGITNREYSGFQKLHKYDIRELINSAINERLLQMCYIHDNILFVHAGVTRTWCKANKVDMFNIDTYINNLFYYKPIAFEFTCGTTHDKHGDEICQTPIWVRSRSLYIDKIAGYIQVVGHTVMDFISGLNGSRKIYTQGMMVETSGVIFIDTLGTSGEYLLVEDGNMSAKTIR